MEDRAEPGPELAGETPALRHLKLTAGDCGDLLLLPVEFGGEGIVMSEPVFMFDGEDPEMREACEAAQRSFKYFWRELSWEQRRIVPGLDMAMVKLPFT